MVFESDPLDEVDLSSPPNGAWFEESPDGWTIGSTTQSPACGCSIPFLAVWTGGVSMGFVEMFRDANPGLGFLIPFVTVFLIVFIAFACQTIMFVCGKVTVTVVENRGEFYMGVGPFSWRRHFNWNTITSIEEGRDSENRKEIVIVGHTRERFGRFLTPERREFMLGGLRHQLALRKGRVANNECPQ